MKENNIKETKEPRTNGDKKELTSKRNSKQSRRHRSSNSSKPKYGRSNDKSKLAESANLDSRNRDNDPNWYFTNAELANQASQLSFQNILGTGNIIDNVKVPTIMAIGINPSPMVSYNVERPATITEDDNQVPPERGYINTVAHDNGLAMMSTKIYTLLSSYTGRTASYGPDDVSFMILATGEIASISEHLRRAFGLALTYNDRNRSIPGALLRAMRIDPDDFFANLSVYRMKFNVLMTRINQIPLLDNVGYIRKCREMYQRIYLDSPSSMGQVYFMMPATTWRYKDAFGGSGGSTYIPSKLETISFTQNRDSKSQLVDIQSFGNYLDILEDMIHQMLYSSELNLVYMDLLNLANKVNVPLWKFDYLPENYVVLPEYNESFLDQVHNLDAVGNPNFVSSTSGNYPTTIANSYMCTNKNDVMRDTSSSANAGVTFVYSPAFYIHSNFSSAPWNNASIHDTIIDLPTDSPTIEDRLEALRYSACFSGYHMTDKTNKYNILPALPDHYVTTLWVTEDGEEFVEITTTTSLRTAASTTAADWVRNMSRLVKFTKHPFIYVVHDDDYNEVDEVIGDTTFFTTVGYTYIQRLNRVISTGLFDFRM